MSATVLPFQSSHRAIGTLSDSLVVAHDNWMADADRFLQPITNADHTFWERWAALRYVDEHLLGRFQLERDLLEEIRAFLLPEMRERLTLQADRLTRMLGAFRETGGRRDSARELAHVTRQLVDALRLWYAEIEFAAGRIQWSDVSRKGAQLLAQFNPSRCGWADAHM
jgi:hypothetical protein